jgi:hypothetical protein
VFIGRQLLVEHRQVGLSQEAGDRARRIGCPGQSTREVSNRIGLRKPLLESDVTVPLVRNRRAAPTPDN